VTKIDGFLRTEHLPPLDSLNLMCDHQRV